MNIFQTFNSKTIILKLMLWIIVIKLFIVIFEFFSI